MAATYTTNLNLAKHAAGDTNWHTELNSNMDKLDALGAARAGARARLSADQTIPSGANTKINLNTEDYDIAGNFDNSTNYRFTAPHAGYYHIHASICWTNCASLAGISFVVLIYKNGAAGSHFYGYTINHANQVYLDTHISDTLYLAQNDYIELYGYQNSGVDKSAYASSTRTFLTVMKASY